MEIEMDELLDRAIKKMSHSSSEFWRRDIKELKELNGKLRFFEETLMKIPTLRKSYEKQNYVK